MNTTDYRLKDILDTKSMNALDMTDHESYGTGEPSSDDEDPFLTPREDLGERKESVITCTDSGISVNSLSHFTEDQSEAEIEESRDQRGPRYSMDVTSSRRSKFRGKSLHRRSCSLPDILDFEKPEVNCEDGSFSPNSYFYAPLCGKTHVKDANYICMKDWEIYCNVCVQVHNFHCTEKVKYIPEIAPEVMNALCNQATRDLLSTRERFERVKHENIVNLDKLKENRKTCVKSIMEFKNEVLQIVNKIEKEALQTMDEIYNKEKAKIEENIARLDSDINTLETFHDNLLNNTHSNNSSTISDLQEATKQCRVCESAIQYLHKSSNVVFFSFETLDRMNSFLNDIDNMWRVRRTEVVTCSFPAPCSCEKPYSYRSAIKDQEFSGRHSGWSYDKEKCCFTGCEFLSNGNLLVCDNSNKKVKLFDRKYKCYSILSLPSQPWDVTITEPDVVAVTMPDKKAIQFISAQNKLTPKQIITMRKNCWGICYYKEHLYVTCWSPDGAEVDVTDMNGNVRQVIRKVEGVPLHTPWYITVHSDVIYVSDWGTFTIPAVSVSGRSIQTYRNRSLQGPLGITSDPEGNLYVCGRDSDTILQVSADGEKTQIILSEKDGVSQPLSLSHCSSDDRFVMTSWMSDKISVFRLQ